MSFNAIFATEDEIKAQQEQQKQMMEANQTKQTKEGQTVYKGEIPTLSLSEKDNPKYEKITADFARISPPISSKFSRLRQAGRTFSWEKEEMREKGFAIDNPALQASANVISAATNIPIDRLVRKANNINTAVSQDLELWERFALLGGWQDWELGIDDEPGSSGKKVGFGETRQTRKRVKSKRVKQKRKRTN